MGLEMLPPSFLEVSSAAALASITAILFFFSSSTNWYFRTSWGRRAISCFNSSTWPGSSTFLKRKLVARLGNGFYLTYCWLRFFRIMNLSESFSMKSVSLASSKLLHRLSASSRPPSPMSNRKQGSILVAGSEWYFTVPEDGGVGDAGEDACTKNLFTII